MEDRWKPSFNPLYKAEKLVLTLGDLSQKWKSTYFEGQVSLKVNGEPSKLV